MAPAKDGETHTIDRTPEYEEFMAKLKAYHAQRGTTLDPEPKVGMMHLDLYKVFNHIVEAGGYDKVSDEKLAWRRMASELGIYSTNEASTAFSLKEKFYKNLAAYEISTIHNKEPPPKDILEDVTAKGAALLSRTRENFRGVKRDSNVGADSGDDATPTRDRQVQEAGGSSVRASRGLREAPPQRVIFQPDTGSSRPTRHSSGQHTGHTSSPAVNNMPSGPGPSQGHHTPIHPPQPQHRGPRGASSSFNPLNSENVSAFVSSYEPRHLQPIPLRPVATPGNNPVEFARQRQLARQTVELANRQAVQPGMGFEGPNIYLRCLNALRSGIPSEQSFALFHLVKISYERGDKYKFESFPGLGEGLVDKALEVGSLFYDVNWSVSWDIYTDPTEVGTLDGNNGTDDVLERIQMLKPKDVHDLIQTEEFSDQLVLINEATLTIRNMVTLPENAVYMADFLPLKDLICIILHLPSKDCVVELKHSALDIAEQLTPFMALDSEDPLYKTLIGQLDATDRGMILTALRAVGRVSMNLESTNKLGSVPATVLQNITHWLLLNDDELMDACLDFLYQYTAVVPNVDHLLRSVTAENLVSHLVRLLSHGARKVQREIILGHEKKVPLKDDVAPMPQDLLQQLLKVEEPERCHQWVRCFFEEDKESFVTQIAAWQAYQNAFNTALKANGQQLITPADFIRNSTSVYKESKAEVLRAAVAPGEMQQKFIIQGIRARARPVNTDGKEYFRCLWHSESGKANEKCGQLFINPEMMWNHVLTLHLKEARNGDGRYVNAEKEYVCKWAACKLYDRPTKIHLVDFARHVNTHISAMWPSPSAEHQAKKQRKNWVAPDKTMTINYEETLTVRDDRNPSAPPQAAGIPLSAILILRNIARNVVKTQAEEELLKKHELGGEGGGWNERLFRSLCPRLFELLAENRALSPYIASLIDLIQPDIDA